ncbi:nucleotidyltransferase domain-containing protein [Actinopolymorpha sp. NPDC004070]|uniref:nucleotidyltransferase domain-containing protein n=1 Tax=Actinopolymorpha sp. NPDC004070 TaxID=3154548 RepID=UPI0033AD51B6
MRGFYLRGSHASGTSTDGSDLDLYVVFKDHFDADVYVRSVVHTPYYSYRKAGDLASG